jgi:hypothetical protein
MALSRGRLVAAAVTLGALPALVAGQALMAGGASAAPATVNPLTAPVTPALAAQLSAHVNQPVIVILKNQLAQQQVGSRAEARRGGVVLAAQQPLLAELGRVHATHVATINVTITPSAATGTVVSGALYVDDLLAGIPPYSQTAGDEVTALPYQYTVG